MKEVRFDQYVRSQFEGEAIAPPAHIEEAVFSALAATQRRNQLRRGAAGVLLVGACAVGMWLNNSADVAHSLPAVSTEQPALVPASLPAVAVEDRSTVETGGASAAETIVDQPTSAIQETRPIHRTQPSASARSSDPKSDAMERPGSMKEAQAKELNSLAWPDGNNPAELLEKQTETWIMPATVKVKE